MIYLHKTKVFPQRFSSTAREIQLNDLEKAGHFLLLTYSKFKNYLMEIYQKCDSQKYRYFLIDFIDYIDNAFYSVSEVEVNDEAEQI